MFAKIDAGEVEITGSDGLLPALLKTTLDRGLQAELTGHLGYEKGEPAPAIQAPPDLECVDSGLEPGPRQSPLLAGQQCSEGAFGVPGVVAGGFGDVGGAGEPVGADGEIAHARHDPGAAAGPDL